MQIQGQREKATRSTMKNISIEKETIVNELHKPARRRYKRRKIILKGIDDLWQCDLIELIPYSKQNQGYKYILIVIDCFSKYLWMQPIRNKTGPEVSKVLTVILRNSEKRIPKNLQTDHGKEFYNKTFQKLMQQYKIRHYSVYSTMKASIAERVIRTVKEKLFKMFNLYGSYKWTHLLQTIASLYNNTKHRTIGRKPVEVTKNVETLLLRTVYNHVKVAEKGKFKVGDVVRISKYKHAFEKGYTPNWSTELFKVIKVCITNSFTYHLEDTNGQPIKGVFYEKKRVG